MSKDNNQTAALFFIDTTVSLMMPTTTHHLFDTCVDGIVYHREPVQKFLHCFFNKVYPPAEKIFVITSTTMLTQSVSENEINTDHVRIALSENCWYNASFHPAVIMHYHVLLAASFAHTYTLVPVSLLDTLVAKKTNRPPVAHDSLQEPTPTLDDRLHGLTLLIKGIQ